MSIRNRNFIIVSLDGKMKTYQLVCAKNRIGSRNELLHDVGKESYLSILIKVDALLAVNKSIGFEALLLGKLTVTSDRSAYNISRYLPTFEDLINRKIDMEGYRQVAIKIAKVMLNYYLYPVNYVM